MDKILFISNTANFTKFNRPLMFWCTNNGWQIDYCSPNDETISDFFPLIISLDKSFCK